MCKMMLILGFDKCMTLNNSKSINLSFPLQLQGRWCERISFSYWRCRNKILFYVERQIRGAWNHLLVQTGPKCSKTSTSLLCNYATDIDGCIISHITKSTAVHTRICFGRSFFISSGNTSDGGLHLQFCIDWLRVGSTLVTINCRW